MKETLNIHICTTDSLRAGIDSESMTCFMCGHKTAHLDWVGIMCDTCGADTSWDFDTAGLIRSVRKRTRLSRKEIASLAGLKRETIKSYEWNGPSQKYYEWFKKFIKGYYDEKTNRLTPGAQSHDNERIRRALAEAVQAARATAVNADGSM